MQNSWRLFLLSMLATMAMLFFMNSCSPKIKIRKAKEKLDQLCLDYPQYCKDSITVKDSIVERFRVDSIHVPGDSIPFEVRIECDEKTNKPKPLIYNKDKVKISIDSEGRLTGMAFCDSLLKVIETKDREIFRLTEKTRTFEIDKKKLPLQKVLMAIKESGLLMIILVVLGVLILIKWIFK
jgi:hypothetical protein